MLLNGYPELSLCHAVADLAHLEGVLKKRGLVGTEIGVPSEENGTKLPADDQGLIALRDAAFLIVVFHAASEKPPVALVDVARILIEHRDRLKASRAYYPEEAAYYLLRRAQTEFGLKSDQIEDLLPQAKKSLSPELVAEAELAAADVNFGPDDFLNRDRRCRWLDEAYPPALPRPTFACKAEGWENR